MTKRADAMKALAPFVGVWNTTGEVRVSGGVEAQRLVATDTYEWLPGKAFLLHRADARLGEQVTRSTEIIGWDDEAGVLFSTAYDDRGTTSYFRCALDDRNWRIDGNGIRFRGAFGESWNALAGTWEMEREGSWTLWMDIALTRAN